eukprot:171385_1
MTLLFTAIASQIVFINALSIKLDTIPEGMVATPHGIRPKQCVHQVYDNDHIIKPMTGGVLVEYPGLQTSEWFPELPECVENAKQLQNEWTQRAEGNLTSGGYELYGLYTTPNKMGNFSATYTLPNDSPTNNNQILYYFVGIQATSNNVTIIQPCIGYCPGNGGCGPAYGNYVGWSMSSWNCCPSGETHYGKGIKLEPGVTVEADTYSTGSYAKVWERYNGQTSVLQIQGDYRDFDLLVLAGEFYDWKGCDDFNKNPFMFRNMKITDIHGNKVDPKWDIINNIKNCGASLTINGNTATMIGKS